MKLAIKLIFEHYKAHRAEEPTRAPSGAKHRLIKFDRTEYYDRQNYVPTKALRLPQGPCPNLSLEIGDHYVS